MRNETLLQRIWRKIRFTKDVERVDPNIHYDYVNNCNIKQGIFIPGKCRCCGTQRKI